MNCKRLAAFVLAVFAVLVYNGSAKAEGGTVTARAAVVMEQSSHRVLFEKNAHERLAMASTTKIMTALVAIRHGNPSDIVKVSVRAAGVPGSSIYLKAGEELTLEQLLYGLMLQSGNDASVAIAEHVGGSVDGFLALMNEEAVELGLQDTHFASPNGLDCPGHYTSAYDLALISCVAMESPEFRKIVSTKSIRIPYEGLENGRFVKNKNKILSSYEGANGVKTGYTGDAGRCFVGAAEREGMQLVSVVLNSGPMFEESTMLMDEAFARYDMALVVEPRMTIGTAVDAEGVNGVVRVGSPVKLTLPLDKDEQQRVTTSIRLNGDLKAPIAYGQPVGEADVVLDGKVIGAYPVIALERDDERTLLWYAKQVIEGFTWRRNGEGSVFRSIWPAAESLRAGNARN